MIVERICNLLIDMDKTKIKELAKENKFFVLPQMVALSNNSILTNQVAEKLVDKLTLAELNDFKRWLKIVETHVESEKTRTKRRFF